MPDVVMEDEDSPLIERKPAEGPLQLVAVGERLDVVRVVRPIDREDAHGRCPSPVARSIRVAGVDKDPVGPCLEAVWLPQVRQLPPDGHEGVLQNVLGEAGIAQDAPSDPEQRVADLVHQIRECRLVARARPLDEVSVHGSPASRRGRGDRGLSSMRVGPAGIVQNISGQSRWSAAIWLRRMAWQVQRPCVDLLGRFEILEVGSSCRLRLEERRREERRNDGAEDHDRHEDRVNGLVDVAVRQSDTAPRSSRRSARSTSGASCSWHPGWTCRTRGRPARRRRPSPRP